MLKINIMLVLLLSGVSLSAQAADSYTIDPSHTYAHFRVSHLGFSTMLGRFDKSSGKIMLDIAAKKGSADISIEANSVNTGWAKRDEHLRGPDFFNAAEYPAITFKSTAIKFKGDVPVSVEGNLSILGTTRPVTIAIESFKCGPNPMNQKKMCGADASAQIKRSDFGMKYGLPNVGDDIKLIFEVEAYKD